MRKDIANDVPAALPIPMLLSVLQAAKFSGVSKSELYRRIQSGRLPAKLIGGKMVNGQIKGGKYRIRLADLIAAIDNLPNVGD